MTAIFQEVTVFEELLLQNTMSKETPTPPVIHVLLMKDNLSSKTLTISAQWFSRLGWSVSFLALLALASLLFAMRSYKLTRDIDPSHVRDLEGQVSALKASVEDARTLAPTAAAPPVSAPSAKAAEPPAAALIDFAQVATPSATELPFNLQTKTLKWRGNMLSLRFKIEYIREDGGNQQGRIVLIGRGGQQIAGYPQGLFATDQAIQVKPERGEYFSVSRLRFVNADFGPFASRKDIDYVDILIFDLNNRLIYFERIKPSTPAVPPRPAEVAEPATTPPSPIPEAEATGEPVDNTP